jgi:predicted Abi (CAAX) family protease
MIIRYFEGDQEAVSVRNKIESIQENICRLLRSVAAPNLEQAGSYSIFNAKREQSYFSCQEMLLRSCLKMCMPKLC